MSPLPPFLLPALLLCAPALAQGGDWIEYQVLPAGGPLESFGISLGFVGDLDGDRCADWVAGAPGASPGGLAYAGTLWVHSGRDGSLIRSHDGAASLDSLGYVSCDAGDLDGDGVGDYVVGEDAVAGTLNACSGATGASLWRSGSVGARNGAFVDGGSDMDGDGVPDLLVGEPYANLSGQVSNGHLVVVSGADGSILYDLWGASREMLGCSARFLPDTDGDGVDEIMVGLPGYAGYSGDGAVAVYRGGPVLGPRLLLIEGTASSISFGQLAGPAGDLDGDGVDELAVLDFGPQAVNFFSGAYGHLLRSYVVPVGDGLSLGNSVPDPADYDRDGIPETVVKRFDATAGAPVLDVISGADGLRLAAVSAPAAHSWYFGYQLAAGLDATGDGTPDVLAGDPGSNNWAGQVSVHGLDPFLHPSSLVMSVSGGASIQYGLQFPMDAAGDVYQLLVSAAGIEPTSLPNGVVVLLTLDPWLAQTFLGSYPSVIQGPTGVLDANAAGTVDLTVPPGALSSSLIGTRFHLAVVCQPGGMLYRYASLSVPLEVVP